MISAVMYRNPVEEWLWESGAAYWFFGALIGYIALVVAWTQIDRIRDKRRRRKYTASK